MNLNLELLIKLMRLTASANDGEALAALRKASEHIAKNGWDWDKLLRGKVAVAADPFAGVDFNAMMQGRRQAPTHAATTPPQAPPRPRPPPPPQTMHRAARRNSKPKINLSGLGISI